MALYIKKNLAIGNIIKSYVAEEDYYPYSIDESCSDCTNSWHLFADSPWDLAVIIRDRIKQELGLVVTICLGDNPLLAKIGMDIEAKKNPDFMTEWRYEDVATKLWAIEPLSEFWGIGAKTEEKLKRMGINSMYDLAHANPYRLKEKLGVIGLQLFAHAHGIDRTILSEPIITKEKSLGNSQVLNYDYTDQREVEIVISEMADGVAQRIREKGYQTSSVSLFIRYSRNEPASGFSKQVKVPPTSESTRLKSICLQIFRSNYDPQCAVRQIGVTYAKLVLSDALQTNLFEDPEKQTLAKELDFLVDKIRNKYGYSALVHANSVLSGATAISRRDHLIGGH